MAGGPPLSHLQQQRNSSSRVRVSKVQYTQVCSPGVLPVHSLGVCALSFAVWSGCSVEVWQSSDRQQGLSGARLSGHTAEHIRRS